MKEKIHPEEKAVVQLKQKMLYLATRLRGMRVAGYVRVSTNSFTKVSRLLCSPEIHSLYVHKPSYRRYPLPLPRLTDLESSRKEKLALGSVLRGNCC